MAKIKEKIEEITVSMDERDEVIEFDNVLPLLALRDVVVFPYMVVPLFVGRDKSIKAVEIAMLKSRHIALVSQRDPHVDNPHDDELYDIGAVGEIMQLLKMPDGTIKVLIEGIARIEVEEFVKTDEYFEARVRKIEEDSDKNVETQALMRNAVSKFEQYIKLNKKVPLEVVMIVLNIEEPGRLADVIMAHLFLSVKVKQEVLEIFNHSKRLEKLLDILHKEIEVLRMEKKIKGRVRQQMEKVQKEYYLREQIKAIQSELGDKDDASAEIEEYEAKLKKLKLPKEVRKKAERELKKLSRMSMGSAEGSVVRNYLDWIIDLPWCKKSKDKLDIKKSKAILDEDHFGLDKVKERILEYLSVRKLANKIKGPILCLIGPPGVGKTSLGKSIARSLGREFVRMSLGGLRDEAEVRGHRRTYVGAMPGRIIQGMRMVKTRNPVFLLDEIDKIKTDFHGDPSAALLEVLDPEQNSTFRDHYLDLPFDLSDVMFVTTGNLSHTINSALLDRMEVIRIPGYTEEEKQEIARQYLVPKQTEENGLKEKHIDFSDSAITKVIRYYTREAGVRNLEREIGAICRKVAKDVVEKGDKHFAKITSKNVNKYLGVEKYHYGSAEKEDQVGIATGLAWTQVGGVVLPIEVLVMDGKGKLILTGSLGEVMKESAHAALSYIRSRSELGLNVEYYHNHDIHIHFPEGATPKDGPSAGAAITLALYSALSNRAFRKDVAMTGEVTLRGNVLPIGGVKEKVLAAHRVGIKTVFLPKANEKDIADIPAKIRKKINIVKVETIDCILNGALREVVKNKKIVKPVKKTVAKKKSATKVKKNN